MKSVNITLKAASLIAIPFTLGLASSAQAVPGVPNPISAQIGGGWLTSSSAKDATSSTGLHVGAAVGLANHGLLSAFTKPSVDVDYNTNSGHGNHINVFGLNYAERVPLSAVGAAVSATGHHAVPYVGLGVGVFRSEVSKTVTTTFDNGSNAGGSNPVGGGSNTGGSNTGQQGAVRPNVLVTTTSHESKTAWKVGGKLLAGVDFGQTFVEASYDISGSTNGVRTDAVNLALGMHF